MWLVSLKKNSIKHIQGDNLFDHSSIKKSKPKSERYVMMDCGHGNAHALFGFRELSFKSPMAHQPWTASTHDIEILSVHYTQTLRDSPDIRHIGVLAPMEEAHRSSRAPSCRSQTGTGAAQDCLCDLKPAQRRRLHATVYVH